MRNLKKVLSCSSLLLMLVIISMPAFEARAQFRSDGCGCPLPDDSSGGERYIPGRGDNLQRLSGDGKYLAYRSASAGAAYVLDLATLKSTQIEISPRLAREYDFGFGAPIWSPYDPDLLAFIMNCRVDTSLAGGHTFNVTNIYTYRVSTKECRRISPDTCGPVGPYGLAFIDWFPSSSSIADSMFVAFPFPNGEHFTGVYCPQTQHFLPYPTYNNQPLEPLVMARSRDGSHIVTLVNDLHSDTRKQTFFLDGSQISAPRNIDIMQHASFSPNSKLVALTVDPIGTGPTDANGHFTDTVFTQVWIFSSDNPAPKEVKVINFQCLFCKYNFLGADAEFLTDSTLAVGMHADLDNVSPLWEITIDGRVVRQLTYLPSKVAAEPPTQNSSFSVWPTIADRSTKFQFASSNEPSEFTMTNELGVVVLHERIPARQSDLTVETAKLQAGAYFCKLRTGSGELSVKFIVQH
jgi:hypothetical protein